MTMLISRLKLCVSLNELNSKDLTPQQRSWTRLGGVGVGRELTVKRTKPLLTCTCFCKPWITTTERDQHNKQDSDDHAAEKSSSPLSHCCKCLHCTTKIRRNKNVLSSLCVVRRWFDTNTVNFHSSLCMTLLVDFVTKSFRVSTTLSNGVTVVLTPL